MSWSTSVDSSRGIDYAVARQFQLLMDGRAVYHWHVRSPGEQTSRRCATWPRRASERSIFTHGSLYRPVISETRGGGGDSASTVGKHMPRRFLSSPPAPFQRLLLSFRSCSYVTTDSPCTLFLLLLLLFLSSALSRKKKQHFMRAPISGNRVEVVQVQGGSAICSWIINGKSCFVVGKK